MQPSSPSRLLRIDPQHTLQDMLQESAARMLGQAVRVTVHEDRVLLTGRVFSWHEKQLAQEIVRPRSASRLVCNQLTVHEHTTGC